MRQMTVGELIRATGGKLVFGSEDGIFSAVSTDSRTVKEGDCFFALVGEKFDANSFLGEVALAGCKVIVASDEKKVNEIFSDGSHEAVSVILVPSSLEALRRLAKSYLESLPLIGKIGVTGSVGKTSTRDMIYYVMSSKYKAARSVKNFNNAVGLPLSLLSFPPDTEIAVIEMGMDGKGSIDYNSSLVKPDTAVITNVGISHIGNFPEDGRMGILNTKLEICNYFDEHSLLVINTDNDMLEALGDKGKLERGELLLVGSSENADFSISSVIDRGSEGISFSLKHSGSSYGISLGVPGAHNAINAALAIAVGERYGISPDAAIEALKGAALTEKRLSVVEVRGIKIIDDTYNAAPESMKSAINTLMSTDKETAGRHIAILGDMGELGKETEESHREIGSYAYEKRVDVLLAIGEKSADMMRGWKEASKFAGGNIVELVKEPYIVLDDRYKLQAEHFPEKETVMQGINEHLKPGDVVLLKASRYMEFEKIVKIITGE